MIKMISDDKNTKLLKFGEMLVQIKYSNENKTINECMYDILKQKIKYQERSGE